MMKQVYTLEDLGSREMLDAGADKPARLAVLGLPVAHSASPKMHQAALDFLGVNVRYIRLEVELGKIAEAFRRMRELGFIGCNVTVPHKLAAMEHCSDVDADARALGAVNTVCFDGAVTRGYNTDGPGFARAVNEVFDVSLRGLSVVIAGAGGGAGQAIAAQCVLSGVSKLVLVNRTISKIDSLLDRLRLISPALSIEVISFDDITLVSRCLAADLIVNTTSLGLHAGDVSALASGCFAPKTLVYDTIYQPPVTPLLALAADAGCRTANGFTMLLHQGVLAFQHWFPQAEPLAQMRAALASPA